MTINISAQILNDIQNHGERAYPEEGAGLMMGFEKDGKRIVTNLLILDNAREEGARHNRYMITAEDMLRAENEAERLGMSIIGIFHSHPDHPNQPSEFDREYAIPWYSYLITSVNAGKTSGSKSWRLADDRSTFVAEEIKVI